MNPYLQAMLMRASAQQETPGGDQAMRPGLDWRQMYGVGDPGIYGPAGGLGGLGGGDIGPVRMAAPTMAARQTGIAQNVMRDMQRGVDPVLTGSGFEVTPNNQGTAFDMLQQYLRQPQAPANALGQLYSQTGFGQ